MDSSSSEGNDITANINVCGLSSNHKFDKSIDKSESLSLSIDSDS